MSANAAAKEQNPMRNIRIEKLVLDICVGEVFIHYMHTTCPNMRSHDENALTEIHKMLCTLHICAEGCFITSRWARPHV